MAGRKGKYPITEIIEILERHNTTIVSGEKIVPPSNKIWKELKDKYFPALEAKNIYTIAIRNKSQFLSEIPESTIDDNIEEDRYYTSDRDDNSNCDDNEKFTDGVINFSRDEWDKIRPREISTSCQNRPNRIVYMLPKGRWTTAMNRKIWEAAHLQCTWVFKSCKVYPAGVHFISITGFCKQCQAKLRIQQSRQPDEETTQISMDYCIYNYISSLHGKLLKRRLAGEERVSVAQKLVVGNISCVAFRTGEADEIMRERDPEPSHLYTSQQLRMAKYNYRIQHRIHSDPVLALVEMKYRPEYVNCIREVAYDKFYAHYWSTLQIQVWNRYKEKDPLDCYLSIDATGSLVRKLDRPNSNISKAIFLYQGVVNDGTNQFPVVQMLSERHDTLAIHMWLSEWVRSGAKYPKQVVTDFSLALLGAVVRSFTSEPNLDAYLRTCAKILKGDLVETPPAFIRVDVAHVIKIITRWESLRTLLAKDRRTRSFYLRCFGALIQIQSFDMSKKILQAMLVVALSETDGFVEDSIEVKSPAEVRRDWLRKLLSDGTVESIPLPESNESQNEIIDKDDLLQTEKVLSGIDDFGFAEVDAEVQLEIATIIGERTNAEYLPNLKAHIHDLWKTLPLWSAIMVPHFRFGKLVASSASVESEFNTLKTHVLRNHALPLRVDEFIPLHTKYISGKLKISSSSQQKEYASAAQVISVSDESQQLPEESQQLPEESQHLPRLYGSSPTDVEESTDEVCPLCSAGNTPPGGHSCLVCSKAVHAIEPCSYPIEGEDEGYGSKRLCTSCKKKGLRKTLDSEEVSVDQIISGASETSMTNISAPTTNPSTPFCSTCGKDLPLKLVKEPCSFSAQKEKKRLCDSCFNIASTRKETLVENEKQENWRGKVIGDQRRKKKRTYLTPDPDMAVHKFPAKKPKLIRIMRNGNSSSAALRMGKKRISFANTCAFDAIVHSLAVAYADSDAFQNHVDTLRKNKTLDLVTKLISKNLSNEMYRLRGEVLYPLFCKEGVAGGIEELACDVTAPYLARKILTDFPSFIEESRCSSEVCPEAIILRNLPVLTVNETIIAEEGLSALGSAILNCYSEEDTPCLRRLQLAGTSCSGARKSVYTSQKHLFIDFGITPTQSAKGSSSTLYPQHLYEEGVEIALHCFPSTLQIPVGGQTYTLRSVIAFRPSLLTDSSGHYVSFSRKSDGFWYSYDDLKPSNAEPVSTSVKIVPHVLFYTL